ILTPTRELAIQIEESLRNYGIYTGLNQLVIFGGVPQNAQTNALRRGVDILVATPGRLLDLMNQGFIDLRSLEIFVLDEADRMLDMGFVHDVKRIITKIPAKRQTLFFSATMPAEIQKLADTILSNPAKVEVTPVSSTAQTITQSLYYVGKGDKKSLLNHLLQDQAIETALVFTRTKHGADKVQKDLSRAGITAEAIHGNKSQNARQRALHNFKTRQTRVLVATDIAARGIDVDNLSHVINFDLPNIPETYVHSKGPVHIFWHFNSDIGYDIEYEVGPPILGLTENQLGRGLVKTWLVHQPHRILNAKASAGFSNVTSRTPS
ncbi:MAG: DEAD/DEAH box helicase, partial [Proteobacteria bacterium]